MSKFKIVITDDRYGSYTEEKKVLEAIGGEIVITHCTTPEEVIAVGKDADGLIVNLAPVPAQVINSLEKCKVIARYGVGYDNVDVKVATEKKIYVTNVPDYCGEDVSDHTIALLMSCLRKIALVDKKVRAGEWNVTQKEHVCRLKGKTYGLVGYGMISKIVHRKLKGFELGKFVVYDPFIDAETLKAAGCRKVELDELCAEADFISVHTPLNEKTRGMIGAKQFSLMKPTAILVNVSRGPVVDEKELIKSLKEGKILGAGIDVYDPEPPAKGNELLSLDNVVLTDHAGWYTVESIAELKTKVAKNIAAVLQGEKPPYPVNSF